MVSPSEIQASGAVWVWPAESRELVGQYVRFRHEFDVDRVDDVPELLISAASDYAAYLNGEFVAWNQYGDFPWRKVYDRIALTRRLRAGRNVLEIVVYHVGEDFFRYLKGPAGLIYALRNGQTWIASGPQTQWRTESAYRQGPMPEVTRPLGPTFEYDARKTQNVDPWQTIRPQDTFSTDEWPVRDERPIEKLRLEPPAPARVIAQGVFRRDESSNPDATVARRMLSDFLSPRHPQDFYDHSGDLRLPNARGLNVRHESPADGGVYLVIDLGCEEAGLLELDIDASAGAIVDVAWGEHLDILRVSASIGPRNADSRNFASRYIARDGRQTFMHPFLRLGGRYLQLHVSGAKRFVLHYAGLRPTPYPLEHRGRFETSDWLLRTIYDVSVRTLELCMHEHYEDCPWREQSLYANDARNQALCGYYAFGEYRFPAASFMLFAETLRDDGYTEMCAPARIEFTIPSFSMLWVADLGDHYLYSGDASLARSVWPKVSRMMDTHLSRLVDDVLPCPTGNGYWHFYDWAAGLAGGYGPGYERVFVDGVRFDAPLNACFVMALDAAVRLARAADDPTAAERIAQQARRLRAGFHAKFWNTERELYKTYVGCDAPDHWAELTQSLALCIDACPDNLTDALRRHLARSDTELVATTLSQSLYKFWALLQDAPRYGGWVFQTVADQWSGMLRQGATSFWETLQGAEDFDHAGSLCHGWSAIPVYLYHAYLTGIRPLEPGFRRFVVDPVVSAGSGSAAVVPTPAGPIEFSWRWVADRLHYRLVHPPQLTPQLSPALADGIRES